MWTLEPQLRHVRSFRGHVQDSFLVRSCFGAVKNRFVLSGSEGELLGPDLKTSAHDRRPRVCLAVHVPAGDTSIGRSRLPCQLCCVEPGRIAKALCKLQRRWDCPHMAAARGG